MSEVKHNHWGMVSELNAIVDHMEQAMSAITDLMSVPAEPEPDPNAGHRWVDRHDGDRPVCRDCGANPGDHPVCEPAERAIERLRDKRIQKSKAVVESDCDLDDMAEAIGNGEA